MDYLCRYSALPGGITMSSDGTSLTGLWFDGQKYFGSSLGCEREERALPVFEETARWLDRYFSGAEPDFTPPLRLIGTDFQRLVWDILLTIPYGRTVTYGQVAAEAAQLLGRDRMSARAVGNAVSRNPISVIVPCHRVVGADGRLTGYAGGLERKRLLLLLEGADPSRVRLSEGSDCHTAASLI